MAVSTAQDFTVKYTYFEIAVKAQLSIHVICTCIARDSCINPDCYLSFVGLWGAPLLIS